VRSITRYLLPALLWAALANIPHFAIGQTRPSSTQDTLPHGPATSALKLVASIEHEGYVAGDQVMLDVFVENPRKSAEYFWSFLPENDFTFTLHNAEGKLVPWTRLGEEVQLPGSLAGGSQGPAIVEPGMAVCYRFRLDELFDLTVEGAYSATVSLNVNNGHAHTFPGGNLGD
jgi:hypothetical protein